MIEVNNLTSIPVDITFLKTVAEEVLKREKVKGETVLSIALVGPRRMRKLNKAYRGKNKITDVLAFPESEIAFEKFKIGPFKKTRGLGEVVICAREVKKNAKRFSTTFQEELAYTLIHGVLHLLGYDHEKSKKEAEKMEEKQEHYLKAINFKT